MQSSCPSNINCILYFCFILVGMLCGLYEVGQHSGSINEERPALLLHDEAATDAGMGELLKEVTAGS